MRIICLNIGLLLLVFSVSAQKTKPPVYFFTAVSEKYFTDAETDSLLEKYSWLIFEENNIPQPLFKKHYPGIKSSVAALAQKISQQHLKNWKKKLVKQ